MNVLSETLKSINYQKNDLYAENNPDKDLIDKAYSKFFINRCLYRFKDTILVVNMINKYGDLFNIAHYDFLRCFLPSKSRFSKNHVVDSNLLVDFYRTHYGLNNIKARQYVTILSNDQKLQLIKQIENGNFLGINNNGNKSKNKR
jgi:hypothetical protein